jgi:hypothetical protein
MLTFNTIMRLIDEANIDKHDSLIRRGITKAKSFIVQASEGNTPFIGSVTFRLLSLRPQTFTIMWVVSR